MSYPYLIQGSNIVIVVDEKSYTINKTAINYSLIANAIKANDWPTVLDSLEPKKIVLDYGNGNVSIKGETLYWKDQELHSGLAVKMIDMLREGFPIEPMVNFMENLQDNPSQRAVTELYSFLENGNMPITPDGHFLAYKKVRYDYKDVHSGTMDNSVGQVVEMARNGVDDDKDRTCSSGLHFCSKQYLNNFGGNRIVIVKINPRDVVSIPSDYDDSKGRTCRYEVVGEIDKENADEAFTRSVQSNGNNLIGKKSKSQYHVRGFEDGFKHQVFDHFYVESELSNKQAKKYRKGYDAGVECFEAGKV
jgi:hypothetical protein